MKIYSIFLLGLTFFMALHFKIYAQISDSLDLYEINTNLAISNYYVKNHKNECALSVINNLPPTLKSKINPLILARLYLSNNDSVSAEKCIMNFYSQKGMPEYIPQIAKRKNDFYAIFKKNKAYFDSLYFIYSGDYELNLANRKIEELVQTMIREDQFVRNNLFLFCNIDSTIHPITYIDSINIVKLKKLIHNDSACNLSIGRYTDLFALYLHLSRYDSITFDQIQRHNNKCISTDVKSYYYAILTDNRLAQSHKEQRYYTYLFKPDNKDVFDFKSIDEARKNIGLESLYFTYLNSNIPAPKFYKNYFRKYFICDK